MTSHELATFLLKGPDLPLFASDSSYTAKKYEVKRITWESYSVKAENGIEISIPKEITILVLSE